VVNQNGRAKARPFFFSRSWTSSECVLEVDEIRLVLVGKADVETKIIEVEDIPQGLGRTV
jgi:hypothetical protein